MEGRWPQRQQGQTLEEHKCQAAQPSQARPILERGRHTATGSNAPGKLGMRGVPPRPVGWPSALVTLLRGGKLLMGPGREAPSGLEPEGIDPGPDLWSIEPFAVSPFGPCHSVVTTEGTGPCEVMPVTSGRPCIRRGEQDSAGGEEWPWRVSSMMSYIPRAKNSAGQQEDGDHMAPRRLWACKDPGVWIRKSRHKVVKSPAQCHTAHKSWTKPPSPHNSLSRVERPSVTI